MTRRFGDHGLKALISRGQGWGLEKHVWDEFLFRLSMLHIQRHTQWHVILGSKVISTTLQPLSIYEHRTCLE